MSHSPDVGGSEHGRVGDVFEGGGEYLFLTGGRHNVGDYFSGAKKIPDEAICAYFSNLSNRSDLCRRLGMGYAHLVVPDKHSVLNDFFPLDVKVSVASNFVVDGYPFSSKVIFPIERLKSESCSYLKTDTHLSDLGAICVAAEVVGRLLDLEVIEAQKRILSNTRSEVMIFSGDLGGRLEPSRTESREFFRCAYPLKRFHNNMEVGNNGIVDIWISGVKEAAGRLVVSGDSFGRQICPYLALYFSDVIFLRTQYLHAEVIDAIKPDFVVTQCVERYLPSTKLDESAPPFLMLPVMGGEELFSWRGFCACICVSAEISIG